MKVAVASEKDMVTGHFGHCANFNIFSVDGEAIVGSESIPNPGHRPGFLPKFLNEKDINVIISGGMGGAAVQLFNEFGIEVVIGTTGTAQNAVEKYVKGELQSTGSICHEHAHEGNCGE